MRQVKKNSSHSRYCVNVDIVKRPDIHDLNPPERSVETWCGYQQIRSLLSFHMCVNNSSTAAMVITSLAEPLSDNVDAVFDLGTVCHLLFNDKFTQQTVS